MSLIELHQVSKNFVEGIPSGVSDINLSFNAGDIITILGESGSGKTTLLKLIYGYLVPQEGEVLFNGERIKGPTEKLIPGHDEMRMVTQELTLNLYAKVFDNISSQLSNSDLVAKAELTLQTMEFLRIDHLAEKKIVELSGGEQQRVAIARAVITEPKVLLLDEPFSQVDSILKRQLRDDIERLAKFLKMTIIMVTHDPNDGLTLSNHLIVIKEGKIIREGKPQELYFDPRHAYVANLLGKANILQGQAFLPNPQQYFAVYPQHVQLSTFNGEVATVKSTHFSGAYQEVEIVVGGKVILVHDAQFMNLSAGDEVFFEVSHFHPLICY
ncbi:MAG: ABC transporter ATP-binding protein [Sphingobacteriales bacterium]|nr:ABC transporter ATP-binding protein [Sphingobacteriales bacterium]